jgi:hypothetical protein
LLSDLTEKGWKSELRRVPYEFQKGGNQMLRIKKNDHPPLLAAANE